jgi:hypothetical protein
MHIGRASRDHDPGERDIVRDTAGRDHDAGKRDTFHDTPRDSDAEYAGDDARRGEPGGNGDRWGAT